MRRIFWIASSLCLACRLCLAVAELVWPSVIVCHKIDAVLKGQLPSMVKALHAYHADHGTFPSDLIRLRAHAGMPAREVPHDPWQHPYIYRKIESPPGYVIYSVGRNGSDESGGGDDITTWEKDYSCATYGIRCPPTTRALVQGAVLILLASSFLVALSSAFVDVSQMVLWRRN